MLRHFVTGRQIGFIRRLSTKQTLLTLAVFGVLYVLSNGLLASYGNRSVSVGLKNASEVDSGVVHLSYDSRGDETFWKLTSSIYIDDPAVFVTNASRYVTITPASSFIRLCNRIFRLAAAFALARKSGRTLLMQNLQEDMSMAILTDVFDFGVSNQIVKDKRILFDTTLRSKTVKWKLVSEALPCAYDPSLYQRFVGELVNDDVEIAGYLQSYRYLHGSGASVRRLFTFRSERREVAQHYFGALRDQLNSNTASTSNGAKHVIFVGVHIRRGDLDAEHMRKRGYRTADMTYLYNAMSLMVNKLATQNAHVAFVVCSDSLNWFESQFSIAELDKQLNSAAPSLTSNVASTTKYAYSVHYPSKDAANLLAERGVKNQVDQHFDFTLLSSCNHSIITVGSYGFWTAYLAGGSTVYYRAQFYPNTDIAIEFGQRTTDFFPPQWIPLNGGETDWDPARNDYLAKAANSTSLLP